MHRMALFEEDEHQHDAHGRESGEKAEDPVPGARDQNPAAAERREDRRRAHDEHHEREHARRLHLVEAIADHRADDDHARRAAERLREAQQHEVLDRPGERAAERCEREEHEPAHERRLAAIAIGDRAEEELTEGESEQIGRERALHARRAHRELGGERRQRGKVHVDGERADRHHQAKDEREPAD